MPKISIIIPVYNVEKYIRQCLTSIISQMDEFPGSEIIVVNDGTKDNSMSIVKELSHGREYIRIINQPNGGLSKARNTGLSYASCDFVWFIDSDDWLLKDAFTRVREAMECKPGADVYVTGLNWMREDVVIKVDITGGPYYYSSGIEYLKAKHPKGASQRYIMRRTMLIGNDIQFLPGVIHEDAHFGHIMPLYTKGVYVLKEPVYAYRQREEGSIMHSITMRSAYDSITIHKDLMAFADRRLRGEMKDWFVFECRDVLMWFYQHIKPLYYTPDYRQFYMENKDYIQRETKRCIRFSNNTLSKYRLVLFCYCPRLSTYLTSFIAFIINFLRQMNINF